MMLVLAYPTPYALFNRDVLLETAVGTLWYGHCQTTLLYEWNNTQPDRFSLLKIQKLRYFKNAAWNTAEA